MNGAKDEVVYIACNTKNILTHILVVFDHSKVGAKAKYTSHFRTYPDAVLLSRHEMVFLARGKRSSEITRVQFPLPLVWATSCHKVQGLTLDNIFVDMKGGQFSPR